MSYPRWFRMQSNSRRPQTEKRVQFRAEWPLMLDNQVSTRKGKVAEVPCLKETFAFITCLKDNNNSQELCYKEAESVKGCYKNYLEKKETLRKQTKQAGDFVPEISAKDMDPVQLNKFLSHFPHKLKK